MVAAGAAVVAKSDLVENTDVGGIEMMSAGRQRPVEVEEAGCMWTLAGVGSKRKRVCHRVEEGRRRMSQLIWRETLRNVGRD